MVYIEELLSIDIVKWIITLFVLLFATVAIFDIVAKFAGYVNKPVRWFKKQDDDHELIIATAATLESLKERQNNTDKNVTALVNVQIETLCDRIHQKTRYYINVLHGIPEDEYDDFVRLFKAYESIGGNHGAKQKYEYCINHLPILPVETIITAEEEEG